MSPATAALVLFLAPAALAVAGVLAARFLAEGSS